ncbi:MAG: aminotransferase class I/II-fold pyridoxal phosphate-dependent enzyme [Gammaproteobacteria bacterium]|nr:aminotransferase class I/II-fold pyridoxal phosphate-dependent enzyme [Gammaproteobacteria bacterium]
MTITLSRRNLLAQSGLLLGAATLSLRAQPTGAQKRSRTASGIIRLIANENPYGPGPSAREALRAAIDQSWKYTFRQEGQLRELIAEREGVKPRNIMITAGSAEILRIAGLLYGRPGGEIVAAKPTFDVLPSYARALGCTLQEVALDAEMRHDLDAMKQRIAPSTRLIYICNPNNPTGTLVNGHKLREFVASISAQTPVLVDEAYLDLSDQWTEHTAVPRVIAADNVIVTRTFSKLHGMAGLRIGYAIAPPKIIKQLERFRMSILNLPGLRAATASYQDLDFQAFSREKIRAGMKITTDLLDELKLAYTRSWGNFILFDTGGSVREFSAAMRESGIMIGRSYAPYKSWVRVSMGTVEDMQAFAAAARKYFKQGAKPQ